MKLSELLASEQTGPVFRPLFKAHNGRLTAIRLPQGEAMKEHKSSVPAMLLVLEGEVLYQQLGDGVEHPLKALEYVDIPPDVMHMLTAQTDAYCILIQ